VVCSVSVFDVDSKDSVVVIVGIRVVGSAGNVVSVPPRFLIVGPGAAAVVRLICRKVTSSESRIPGHGPATLPYPFRRVKAVDTFIPCHGVCTKLACHVL
jgi:hypothetical protein